MKINIKKMLVTLIILSVTILTIISVKNSASINNNFYLQVYIEDAFYGDFDSDNSEDDIRVILLVRTNYNGQAYSNIKLALQLPSGYTYNFEVNFAFSLYGSNCRIILTTYNTATESGWYTAKTDGLVLLDNDYVYFFTSSLVFDPPTEKEGPGDPTINVSVSY